jgi:hypothetical protein
VQLGATTKIQKRKSAEQYQLGDCAAGCTTMAFKAISAVSLNQNSAFLLCFENKYGLNV